MSVRSLYDKDIFIDLGTDIVIYNKYIFGLCPRSWLGAPKTLGICCDCDVNKVSFEST